MSRSDQFTEVRLLADDVCSNSATPEQIAELQKLLRGNLAAQEFYYDYLNMHFQMLTSLEQEIEFVYRRVTTAEELVIRAKDKEVDTANTQTIDEIEHTPQQNKPRFNLTIVVVAILLLLALFWLLFNRNPSPIVAKIQQGQVISESHQGEIFAGTLSAGLYKTQTDTTLKLIDGDTIHVSPHSSIKIFNNEEIRARSGKYRIESAPGQNTIIHTHDFIVQSNGSGFTVDLTAKDPTIFSGEKTVYIPGNWRPTHYWSFNGNSDRLVDSAGQAHGISSTSIDKTKGAVGQAVKFDGSDNSMIEVGSGGGTVPGTGTFAVTRGVTIEALLQPAQLDDVQQTYTIFHQQQSKDQVHMSLAMSKTHLNFGLTILGKGYFELPLALDGKNGRPSIAELTNGQFYHVAATYSVDSGLQAIYINAQQLAAYNHPKGSQVFSGGKVTTSIGKGFSGAIDEVAFYGLALPKLTLEMHLDNIKKGDNYFGLAATTEELPVILRLQLPPHAKIKLDGITRLPSELIKTQP
ncbi:LamG-like jellyroll fold domain-containing protein [Catenovulum agarivorans]|uniref:LamG-like jellyroll fold domain-containing protein n=1 Tax=Catenovulum agarivorans TaxID=1172192 RepID=UPI0002E612FB|nr:LamG-like jellyroll fold domain-containing protein [Catenovulum agarivorans]